MTSYEQPEPFTDFVVVGPNEIDTTALIEFVTAPQCGAEWVREDLEHQRADD